jgi:hypothetical protein
LSVNKIYKLWIYVLNYFKKFADVCKKLQLRKREIIRWIVVIILFGMNLFLTIYFIIYQFRHPDLTQVQVWIHIFKTIF